MKTRFFVLATLALSLAACTQDELADDNRLPEGEYPVVIRATGLSVEATPQAAPSTRATVDGDWQGVQTVALKMGDAVKEYTVTPNSADNTKATLSSENVPHYWTSRDPITVSAWWPFDNADNTQMPAVKVAEDQSKLADFQKSDFIAAENRKVEFNNPTLEFTHRTARVTIELKPGTGFTSVAGATVSLVSLSADSGNPTAIKTYNASGNTYEALTAPQTVAAGKPFIRVELGSGTFHFRPQTNVVLEAGNRYTYTIKVNANGIEVAEATSRAWTPGGEEAVESIVFKTDLSTAKVGDFITTDGTLIEMKEGMTLSNEMKKRIAGVVFWTPAETTAEDRQTPASLQSDKVMAQAHPNCTHGLAVSLKDVSAEMKWQKQYESESVVSFQKGDAFNPAYDKSLFKPIAAHNGPGGHINFILGYQNTLILRAYNVYCKSIGSGNKVVLPVDALDTFAADSGNQAPSNSTGWFLPSPKELHILCYKDVDDIEAKWDIETRDIVNKSLDAADGETFTDKYYYWSSSEFGGFLAHAFLVNFRNADVLSVSKHYNTFRVRAVCAF